jgi:hypothetical protein
MESTYHAKGVKVMNKPTVNAKNQGKCSSYNIARTFTMILFDFYGTLLSFGLLGIFGFAAVGLLWAGFLGFIAHRLLRRDLWHVWLANARLSRPTSG